MTLTFIAVVNTKSIYLSVLEAGLSLIAVNLPSLWVLFSKIMPEKVLPNVRSMISLAASRIRSLSRRGAQSQIYSLPPPLGNEQKTISNSSQCRLAYSNGDHRFVESCAMHDIEAKAEGPPVTNWGIPNAETVSNVRKLKLMKWQEISDGASEGLGQGAVAAAKS